MFSIKNYHLLVFYATIGAGSVGVGVAGVSIGVTAIGVGAALVAVIIPYCMSPSSNAWCMRSSNSERFGKPVNGSEKASCSIFCLSRWVSVRSIRKLRATG